MELYWGILFFITLNTILALKCNNRQIRNILSFLSFIILIVLSAIRKDIGVDYFGHYLIFQKIASGVNMVKETDAFYWLVCKFAILFDGGFEFVIAAMTVITLAPIYYISKKEDNPLFLYLYFLVFYFTSYALIRQCCAITYALLGTYFYCKEESLKKGVFFSVIGGLFHASLWANIPVLFLCHYIKLKLKFLLFFSVVLLIMLALGRNILIDWTAFFLEGSYYLRYLDYFNMHNVDRAFGSGLGIVLRHIFYITCLLLGNMILNEKAPKSVLNFNYLFLICVDLLSIKSRIFIRATFIFYTVLFVPFFSKLKIKGNKRQVICVWLMLLFVFSYLILFKYSGDITGWENLPYKTIFS